MYKRQVFAGIRRYSGGYHAKTKLKCYILTITNWAVVIVLQRLQQKFGFTRFGIELIICCMVFMVMFFFAPVENPGKPLFERVRIVNKRKTLIITLMVIIISLSIDVYKRQVVSRESIRKHPRMNISMG